MSELLIMDDLLHQSILLYSFMFLLVGVLHFMPCQTLPQYLLKIFLLTRNLQSTFLLELEFIGHSLHQSPKVRHGQVAGRDYKPP